MKGQVSIVKDGNIVAFLESGSYFGESALSLTTKSKRSATVRAETTVECLSISKHAFYSVFGEEVSGLVDRNILRYLFRQSDLLKDLSPFYLERFINAMTKKVYSQDEVIITEGEQIDRLVFVIGTAKQIIDDEEDSFDEVELVTMVYFGLEAINAQDTLFFKNQLIAEDGCLVYTLKLSDFETCLKNKAIAEVKQRSLRCREMFTRVNMCVKVQNLDNFEFIKNIGIGGYGTVLLCRDSESDCKDLKAIKIVPRSTICSRSSLRMMKVSKSGSFEDFFGFFMNFLNFFLARKRGAGNDRFFIFDPTERDLQRREKFLLHHGLHPRGELRVSSL